jgi:glycosyltransferase involved in cell wall biosynthesis
MKICVLGLRGIPDVMGGVETHCEQLYPRLFAHLPVGASIDVIARKGYTDPHSPPFKGVGVKALWSPRHHYAEAIVHTFLGILYARFVHRFDVLHLHAIGPGVLTPLAKMLGLKVVVTHHGEDYQRAKWNGVARMVLRLGERLAVTFADRVIVVSPSLTRHLKESYPRRADKIMHIPNGAAIDRPADDPGGEAESLKRFGVASGRFILTVARLVPEKAVHELIDAHERSGTDDPLLIAGAAQSRSPYADALLRRASDRVIFAGQLPRQELGVLYRHTRLFVLASHHEGLPIAALEAMSSGARVLLSDIQANQDLQLSSQNHFPCGDIEALARALGQADRIPRCEASEVWRRYDWDGIAKQTADVLQDCASNMDPPALASKTGGLAGIV